MGFLVADLDRHTHKALASENRTQTEREAPVALPALCKCSGCLFPHTWARMLQTHTSCSHMYTHTEERETGCGVHSPRSRSARQRFQEFKGCLGSGVSSKQQHLRGSLALITQHSNSKKSECQKLLHGRRAKPISYCAPRLCLHQARAPI